MNKSSLIRRCLTLQASSVVDKKAATTMILVTGATGMTGQDQLVDWVQHLLFGIQLSIIQQTD